MKRNTQDAPAANGTTAPIDFFKTNGDEDSKLFSVRAGIPFQDALEAAHCLLDTAVTLASLAASELDGGGQPDCRIVHAAHYLTEISHAVVCSVIHAARAESRSL